MKCQICAKTGHPASKCYFRYSASRNSNFNNTTQAFAGLHLNPIGQLSQQPNIDAQWVPDSGATAHMTFDPSLLQQSTNYAGSDQVFVGDGKSIPISQIGSTKLSTTTSDLKLNNVLVVPHISKNLLSVSKLTQDNDCSIEFFPWGFCVKDLCTGKMLLTGPLVDNLYIVPASQASPNNSFMSLLSEKASATVWHQRLGHPSAQVLQHLKTRENLQFLSSFQLNKFCEPCQLGKHHKLPFSVSSRQSSHPLDIVHCDIWGPTSTLSVSGFNSYIIFLDDYSRYTWFYPLKAKSDAVECFRHFKNMAENILSTKVKYFQSDGALELTRGVFKTFLDDCGIVSRISCPHTPEQNGVAERKHRHITEMGLSLLFQAKMPKRYWLEAFNTAVYLINRLPTPVLQGKSPHELLFGKPPDYSVL